MAPRVVRCSKCGVERWYGIGPCINCGAVIKEAVDEENNRAFLSELTALCRKHRVGGVGF